MVITLLFINKKTNLAFQHPPKPTMSLADAPKKPLTGFFLYKRDVYPKTKEANKDMKITEITKLIASNWVAEKPDVKNKYEKQAQVEKEKYEKAKKEFEDKHGSISELKKKEKKSKNKEEKANSKKKTKK